MIYKRFFLVVIFLLVSVFVFAEQTDDSENKSGGTEINITEIEPVTEKDRQPSRTYYYYKYEDFGARAFHNPMNIVIQGSIGALRNRSIVDFDFYSGAQYALPRIINPIKTINDYGWKNFFWDEFIPSVTHGQSYLPNYLWHLFGGGMRYKLMEEYYHFHGYTYPKLCSWLSIYSMHLINEIVQAEDQKSTVDPISDLFIFDFIANFLFEIPAFNKFMTRVLHFSEWSYQTQINLFTGRQGANWGQLFWMRLHIWGPWSISAASGEQVMFTLGPTCELKNGHQLSFGVGPQAKNFVTDLSTGMVGSERLTVSFGIYYSIKDNPVVVITYEPKVSQPEGDGQPGENGPGDPHRINEFSHKLIANLYPGIIKIGGGSIGLTFQYYKDAFYIGVSSGSWPVGLIASTPIKAPYDDIY